MLFSILGQHTADAGHLWEEKGHCEGKHILEIEKNKK